MFQDPLTEREESELKRWHPDFLLDKQPEIAIADLPEPPDDALDRMMHARDYFSASKNVIVNLPKKVQQVIGDLDAETKSKAGDDQRSAIVTATSTSNENPKHLALLERVFLLYLL